MAGLKAANLGLKFLLELVAIAAFANWGASRSPVVLAVILAIATPAVFVAAQLDSGQPGYDLGLLSELIGAIGAIGRW